MKYDVIIAGAGFTGLTLASRIKANVLLIDQFDIGAHNISACATLVKTMRKIHCEDSIVQEFIHAAIHTRNREIRIPLPEPFCTIDFQRFCKILDQQNSATFLKAHIKSVEGNTVITSQGDFSADTIIDATGWQAVLASSVDKHYVKSDQIAFGVETEIDYQDDKLRFFIDQKRIENGAAWLFPAGMKSRFGLAYYSNKNQCNLSQTLKNFVEGEFGLKVGKVHGGGFGYDWKQKVVVNDMFVIGSSAGQTLPLTGEGIRRSIDFGIYCGDLISQIIEGKCSKREAFKRYQVFALSRAKRLKCLLSLQNRMQYASNWKINCALRTLSFLPCAKHFWRWYERI